MCPSPFAETYCSAISSAARNSLHNSLSDGIHCLENVSMVLKPDNPSPRGRNLLKPVFLGDHGRPARQVNSASIAEPPVLCLTVSGLVRPKFTALNADILTVNHDYPEDLMNQPRASHFLSSVFRTRSSTPREPNETRAAKRHRESSQLTVLGPIIGAP